MTNQLATRQNTYLASIDDVYAALATEAEGYKGGGSNVSFLKFNGNDGYYSFGANDEDLPLGTECAMDPATFKRGWICWVGGQPAEEVMLGITEGAPPAKHLLTDHGPYGKDDGWQEQKTVEFVPLDEGFPANLLFQGNNVSKMRALEALIKDFGRKYKSHMGMVPIVKLDARSFETQPEGGRKITKWAPTFEIVDWMPLEEFRALNQGSEGDYEGGEGDAGEGYNEDQAALEAPADDNYDAEPEAPVEEAPAPAARGGRRQAAPAAAPAQEAPAARGGRRQAAPAPQEAAPVARGGRRTEAAPAQAAAPAARGARPAPVQAAEGRAAPRGRRF